MCRVLEHPPFPGLPASTTGLLAHLPITPQCQCAVHWGLQGAFLCLPQCSIAWQSTHGCLLHHRSGPSPLPNAAMHLTFVPSSPLGENAIHKSCATRRTALGLNQRALTCFTTLVVGDADLPLPLTQACGHWFAPLAPRAKCTVTRHASRFARHKSRAITHIELSTLTVRTWPRGKEVLFSSGNQAQRPASHHGLVATGGKTVIGG